MDAVTRTQTTAYWITLFEDKAVPCGPINTLSESFADAQVKARGLEVKQAFSHVPYKEFAINNVATVKTVASPLRLVDTPPVLRRAPPALGEHTEEVLAELGFDAARIAALRQGGVI